MSRDPSALPRDDRRIYDAYVAGRRSAALAVGVRLGLFDLLDAGPLDEEALRTSLDVRARPLRSLLAALLGMRFLERREGRYSLADDVSDYLVRGKPGWLGGLVDLEVEHFLGPQALLEAMRADRATVYGDEDPWEAHERDPERAERFTAAMHSVSERPAAGLAEVVGFVPGERVLDVGGGSGALSLAIARAHPEVRCVVFDLPVVCEAARRYVDAAGLADRVRAEPGDMFASSLPFGYDTILFSQILHDWPPATGGELLRKAAAALPPGGRVLVHEKLVEDETYGPEANALVNLDMLLWTEGQQYRWSELRDLIAGSGFARDTVERRATAGYWTVAIARTR
ncbi:MAG TPA: methyltransferase [bacterium]|nr:methyltransferase [bacterium]